jgi:carboxypeptidase Q
VLGAPGSLIRVGLRPERTLGFVLFTGEEQGPLGSRAYVRRHTAEFGNIVAAFAMDLGPVLLSNCPLQGILNCYGCSRSSMN